MLASVIAQSLELNRMGKVTGFLEYQRLAEVSEPTAERVKHWREFVHHLSDDEAKVQGARCMDCGIPFCMSGCPINNIIPDWNDLVYKQNWKQALDTLHSTNNFPEFTGRVCPAPCEEACTLNINNDPVGHQVDRARHHRQGLGDGLGRCRSRPSARPASAWRWSAPARPGLAARSSWRAPATTWCCSRRTIASAACCATASPTSRWRSG